MERPREGWILTYTGRRFWPLDPHPDDIDLVDIAHALSNLCRFTGHTSEFYSVAQHSYLVSVLCDKYPLYGLLHDASEAYLLDLATPIKHLPQLEEYRNAERWLQGMILLQFGIRDIEIPAEVKECDMAAGIIEGLSFMPEDSGAFWTVNGDMFKDRPKIVAWDPKVAEARFMDRFDVLMTRE